MPQNAASDLGLHCLLMSLLWDARHKWVKYNNHVALRSKLVVSNAGEPKHSNFCKYCTCAHILRSACATAQSAPNLHRELWVAKDQKRLQAASEDSYQPARMPRLIRFFAGRTCYLDGNVLPRLMFVLFLSGIAILSREGINNNFAPSEKESAIK